MPEETIQKIERRLNAFEARDLPSELAAQLRPSAIVLPLFADDEQVHVLLTKRTQKVRHHKGQISFPGGRLEDEESLQDCALRETEEEIGVSTDNIRLLGRLDETPVISGYRITPFVGVIPYPSNLLLSEDEIDSVITTPLSDFLAPEVHSMDVKEYLGRPYSIHFYNVAGETVWGATGRIMAQFLKIAFDYVPHAYSDFLEEYEN